MTTEEWLKIHFDDYPCYNCKYTKDNYTMCNKTDCTPWKAWFKRAWRSTTKLLKRETDYNNYIKRKEFHDDKC